MLCHLHHPCSVLGTPSLFIRRKMDNREFNARFARPLLPEPDLPP
jgi:hypothetical protein